MKEKRPILVVDDQSSIRIIIRRMLNNLNHEVIDASNGRDALAILEQKKDIGVVLCDIHMKGMGGLEVLQYCRSMYPELPVILMSAYTKDELIVDALRQGACDYLIKPFETNQLNSVLHRVEELYLGRNQIIEHKELIKDLQLHLECTAKTLVIDQIQKLIKNSAQLYTNMARHDLSNLSIIIEEALLNAIEHGNFELNSEWKDEYLEDGKTTLFESKKADRFKMPEYANKKIKISVTLSANKLAIAIEDEGKGYAPGKIPLKSNGKPYGMGLLLINNLSDKIKFNAKGNRITIEKHIDN